MFTGIIEERGRVRQFSPVPDGAQMSISAPAISPSLKVGESIAVNGVCLTVTGSHAAAFSCDLSAETLARSSLGRAREGWTVNLERSLQVGARLGGHFVLGHVDGVGRLAASRQSGEGRVMTFEYPSELERYLVYKGSVAVDGISLTIAELEKTSFSVAVVPHTLRATNLESLRTGDLVNLETDIMGKYFERFISLGLLEKPPGKIDVEWLKEQGY